MMKKYIILYLSIIGFATLQAQTTIYDGATLHVGNGKLFEKGMLITQGDKIIYAGSRSGAPVYKDARFVNVEGKHIYPGLINANCLVGLNEIDAARPTRDFSEVGDFNPNVRSMIAFNSDSKIIPTLRFNGVLFVQPVPSGKYITGTSGIMDLSGENWEESSVNQGDGVHLNWYDPQGILKADDENYKDYCRQIGQFFDQASGYIKRTDLKEKNPKFEAMRPVFSGKSRLYIHVQTARGIMQAIGFSKVYGISPVIVGGSESWMIADTLASRKIPVILNKIHRLPNLPGEDVNLPFKIPAILYKAGVKFCISVEGSWECRNLPFNAGTAAAWGLGDEEALRAVSLSVAEITGTDVQIGSLESGKLASFVITEGNLLEMSGNKMIYILIRGKEVPVNAMQQELYQKYHQKYFGTPGQ